MTGDVVMVNEPRWPNRPSPARPAEYAFMYVVDINKDGRSDVVTSMAHSYGVLWFEQQADGQWARAGDRQHVGQRAFVRAWRT